MNLLLETTRKSYLLKQNEVELAEKELKDLTYNLNRLAQEKLHLTEKQKNLNQDSPFAEEYRNDSTLLKQKQANIQQTKLDLDKVESQINTTRTQLEILKHELETKKIDEHDLNKDNDRLEKLVEFKKNSLYGNMNVFPKSESQSTMNLNNTSMKYKTTSQSTNNIRSNTPKGIYFDGNFLFDCLLTNKLAWLFTNQPFLENCIALLFIKLTIKQKICQIMLV